MLFTGVCYSGSENMSICHIEWQGAEWRGIFSLHLCELQSPLPPKVSLGGEAGRIGVHTALGPLILSHVLFWSGLRFHRGSKKHQEKEVGRGYFRESFHAIQAITSLFQPNSGYSGERTQGQNQEKPPCPFLSLSPPPCPSFLPVRCTTLSPSPVFSQVPLMESQLCVCKSKGFPGR